MKVVRLTIEHFRGINKAVFQFDGHALLIGTNNVGKSTVCEALDMVLGPDRLNKFPPVEEFDFYNAEYLGDDAETAIPARIEVVLTELTREIELACPTHNEFWHAGERRLLGGGEADLANSPGVVQCVRLETVARYDKDEDEFEAKTYFCHGTNNLDDTYEGYDIITLKKEFEREYTIPEPQTAEEVIGYYARRIAEAVKLPAQFAALAPKVREFFEQRAFGHPADLNEPVRLREGQLRWAHNLRRKLRGRH